MKKILIGIPTFNGAHRVNDCISSIVKWNDIPEGYDVEILLVDDGSHEPKRSEAFWVASHWNVPIIPHSENMGITKSWNDLASFGNHDIVVLLNDDILVSKHWLTALTFFLENNQGVGMVGWDQDFITAGDVKIILDSKKPIRIYRDPHTKRILAKDESPISDKPGKMMVATGSAFAFTRDTYDLAGGFDERYKSFYEEMDFGTTLAQNGKPSFMLNYPRLYHMFSATFGENDHILMGSKTMAESREKYKEKWGGDLDYTDSKFMPSLDASNAMWLDEKLQPQTEVLN